MRHEFKAPALIGALACILSSTSIAGTIPSAWIVQNASAMIGMEATASDLAMVIGIRNLTAIQQPLGSWNGTVTNSGWNLAFSGSYDSIPIALTSIGAMDMINEKATWVLNGTWGADPVAGDGEFDFDPRTKSKVVSLAKGAGAAGVQAWGTAASAATGPGLLFVGACMFLLSHAAGSINDPIDVDILSGAEGGVWASDPSLMLFKSYAVWSGSPSVSLALGQTGTLDPATGSFSAAAQTSTPDQVICKDCVPEPGTVTLLTPAALLVLCYRRFTRRKA